MYLSRLVIDRGNRRAAGDLEDIYDMHRTVMSVFPDVDAPRGARSSMSALYRVELDRRARSASIIIQSAVRPDWSRLPEGYAHPAVALNHENPATRCMDGTLAGLHRGQLLRFRLRANATKKVATRSGADGRRRNGRRVPLRSDAKRLEWLARKAPRSGFRLVGEGNFDGVAAVRMSSGERSRSRRVGKALTIESVLFDGLLQIADADVFRSAIRAGIGPGKAFGCGLLSIAGIGEMEVLSDSLFCSRKRYKCSLGN